MVRLLLPALLFLTGTTGLLYEVVLGRYLTLYLGSSGASQAVTLAAFLGGLSAGALLAGRLASHHLPGVRRPVLAYAALEGLIGVWALGFPVAAASLFSLYDSLSASVPPSSAASVALKLLFAALLIVPMTSAMGATLPVLAVAVGRARRADAVQTVSRYYAINAAGGALGSLLAGFVLIEALGLEAPLNLAAAVNLAVGGAAALGARRLSVATQVQADAQVEGEQERGGGGEDDDAPTRRGKAVPPDAPPLAAFVVAAAMTGTVSLVYEVVWVRLAGLLLGASVYAFALMLFVIIVGIAAGSGATTVALTRRLDPRRVFAASQVLAAAAATGLALRLPAMPEELLKLRVALPADAAHYDDWLWRGGLYMAAHFLPAALALGAAFPALLAGARRSGATVERATPWILGSNTLGNLTGATLGGFVLMPLLGLENVLLSGACVSLGLSLLCLPRPVPRRWKVAALAGALGLLTMAWLAPPDIRLLHRGLYRLRPKPSSPLGAQVAFNRELVRVFREDGKDASITVDANPRDGLLLFRTNGKPDGSTQDSATQIGLGHLGFVARPGSKDVFVVGLGTGQSAAAAASHAGTRVVVAELSPAVVEVARLFSAVNDDVMRNPRVEVRVADAREVLRGAKPGSWDVVVSEPSNPWVVGVPDLFTVETYGLVKRALRERGVLVQWLQSYEMSSQVLRRILCTVQQVLPHVAVFRLEYGDLALVASPAPLDFAPGAAARDYASAPVQANIAAAHNPRVPQELSQLLSLQLCGPTTVRQLCAGFDAPLRIRRPEIEYRAPRDFYAKIWPKEMLRALDTRPTGHADTWVAKLVREGRADAALGRGWRERTRRWLARLGARVEQPLVSALARRRADRTVPGLAFTDTLPALADLDAAARRRWCARIARRAPWLIDHLQTEFGPVSPSPRLAAWQRACQQSSMQR